jgi:hypothetical protein
MRRAYEIPEIQEQEYRERFLEKGRVKITNRHRDNLFALVVALIFTGLLALSLLISSTNPESVKNNNQAEEENYFVPVQVKNDFNPDGQKSTGEVVYA